MVEGPLGHPGVLPESSPEVLQMDLEGSNLEELADLVGNLEVLVDLAGNLEASVDPVGNLEALVDLGGSDPVPSFALEFHKRQGCIRQQWV